MRPLPIAPGPGDPTSGGQRPVRFQPRGRQVDAASLAEVRALLGDHPRERRHLVGCLHLIQDQLGHLSARHLAALAEEMRLSQAQVYEVATFYSQFIVVPEGETPPPGVVVRVCDGLACCLAGGERLRRDAEAALGGGSLVLRAACMGHCDAAPVASVNQRQVGHATVQRLHAVLEARQFTPVLPDSTGYDAYIAAGGYRLLASCLEGDRERGPVIGAMSDSKLRGLGGAGYPTGQKWASVFKLPRPKVVVVNFDESEMGTFKDRFFAERDPHRLIEGTLVAAWATEAYQAYIYLRDEYHALRQILQRELERVKAEGWMRQCSVSLVRGAGAYVCGERSAMLESIEGKRGYPRLKDPRTTVVGLFGIPTLINNAETLYWVRDILERGPGWFAEQGRNGRPGPRAFSVSGRVRSPGVKLAQSGITMNQLLAEYCGGMQDGHAFKGYCLGGSSGGILPASMADVPLDFDVLEQYGCSIGSAAITVFSDQDPIRDIVLNLMRFFEDESCGQCTPCRVGTEKAVQLIQQERWDEVLLGDLCDVMEDASICGLGEAAPHPIRSALRYFRAELGLPGDPT